MSNFKFPKSNFKFKISYSQFLLSIFQFSFSNLQFPILNSQFPIPNSQFPFSISNFPYPNSNFKSPNDLWVFFYSKEYKIFPWQKSSKNAFLSQTKKSFQADHRSPAWTNKKGAKNPLLHSSFFVPKNSFHFALTALRTGSVLYSWTLQRIFCFSRFTIGFIPFVLFGHSMPKRRSSEPFSTFKTREPNRLTRKTGRRADFHIYSKQKKKDCEIPRIPFGGDLAQLPTTWDKLWQSIQACSFFEESKLKSVQIFTYPSCK